MRRFLSLLSLAMLCAAPVFAQQPVTTPTPPERPEVVAQARPAQTPVPARPTTPPAAPQAPPPSQAPPPPARQLPMPTQNVRVELAITDSQSSASKKIVSILIADGRSGRIRSERGQRLNIDARPEVLSNGKILLDLTIDYFPMSGQEPPAGVPTMINESVSVLVSPAAPTLVSQSADPVSDRKVTVEVTATVVK